MPMLTTHSLTVAWPKPMVLARQLILLALLCLMLCVPILNKCCWLAVGLVLLDGGWLHNWKIMLQDKVIAGGLLLILLFTVGMFYHPGSWHDSLRAWNKYLKIGYVLFFLPLFIHKKNRQQALVFFLFSVMLGELFAYLHYFNIINFGIPSSTHWLFVQDIDCGFIVSFAAYMLANFALDSKKYKGLFLLCFLVCAVDIMILNQERTGYVVFLMLAALFLFQRFHWKGLLSACLIVPLIGGSLYYSSARFNDRISQVFSNVVEYRQGHDATSIGLRLAFAEYSFRAVRQHVWFGLGTGSFNKIYRSMNGPKINNETWPAHPHNEYIAILFQLGVLGLAAFLYWIYIQMQVSWQLPREERRLLQGLIVGFITLSFCNASLLVNPAGACYVLLLAVLMAANYDPRKHA